VNHTRQFLRDSADLLAIALGIIALFAAPQAGLCLNDTSTGTACRINGTMVLDLVGFALIAAGAAWALATRWPTAPMRSPVLRFLATWAIVVVVGSARAFGMLTEWHWGPYCDTSDSCSTWPDMGGAIGFFTVVGIAIATAGIGIHEWVQARKR